MNRKLSELALFAESVSAFALVLSLIFLGFQMNGNAQATRSATANASIASLTSWYSALGHSTEASHNFYTALTNPDATSTETWFQFTMQLHGAFLNFQNSFYLEAENTLDHTIRDSMTAVLAGVKNQPGFRRYWQQRRPIFYPEFQAYIDSIIASDMVNSIGVYPEVDTTMSIEIATD